MTPEDEGCWKSESKDVVSVIKRRNLQQYRKRDISGDWWMSTRPGWRKDSRAAWPGLRL